MGVSKNNRSEESMERKKLVINDQEAETVRNIFSWYEQG
jgi:hypothetical protein